MKADIKKWGKWEKGHHSDVTKNRASFQSNNRTRKETYQGGCQKIYSNITGSEYLESTARSLHVKRDFCIFYISGLEGRVAT